jgi:hypothetical protein
LATRGFWRGAFSSRFGVASGVGSLGSTAGASGGGPGAANSGGGGSGSGGSGGDGGSGGSGGSPNDLATLLLALSLHHASADSNAGGPPPAERAGR